MEDELDFLDSNLWLYSFMAGQNKEKHLLANVLIASSNLRISTQVIGEVCNTLMKKAKMPEPQIRELIASFYERYQPIEVDRPDQLLLASTLRERYRFSHWDSWIVFAALESGCSTLYSEDMQDGLVVNGTLTIRNPFR
jgi:predicted nucleic acid-binding protein